MTTLTLGLKRSLQAGAARVSGAVNRRLVLLIALLVLLLLSAPDGELRAIVLTSLSDAYLQVSVFVAATLAVFYGLEARLGLDTDRLLRRYRQWQVPVAAFMGALPGCGGAIMVMTHYATGRLGFGAVVAVLTATMGDAAFLLIAREPLTGLAMVALGFGVGILSGYVVDALHGPDFMRVRRPARAVPAAPTRGSTALSSLRGAWLGLSAVGLVLGVLLAFQVEPDAVLGGWATAVDFTLHLGVAGTLLALLWWAFAPFAARGAHPPAPVSTEDGTMACRPRRASVVNRVIADTSFVTVWVVVAYLAYELAVVLAGLDLGRWFAVWAPLMPLIGVLVGLLPGCGPQIVVTTLYLGGLVPLSAQIGNAISNDGDALFPAMAIAPGAAVVATLYSAVPAILVAYAYFWIWE